MRGLEEASMDRLSRYVSLTGVVFAILWAAALVIAPKPPELTASGAQLISYFEADQSRLQTAFYLWALATVFLLFFAADLYIRLRSDEASAFLSLGGLIGAAVLSVGSAGLAGNLFNLASNAASLSPAAAQAIFVVAEANGHGGAVTVGGIGFTAGIGLAIIRSRLLPRWMGWSALVVTLVLLLPGTNAGLFLLGLWVLVAGVRGALRRAGPAPTPVAAHAT